MSSKRYVFWRDGTGKPYRKNKSRYAPKELLRQLGEGATVDEKVSWPGGLYVPSYQALVSEKTSIIDADGGTLNQRDTLLIVKSAIKSVIQRNGGEKPIGAEEFVDVASEMAAEHFRKSTKDYTFVTSLSINRFPADEIVIGDHVIRPLKTRDAYPLPEAIGELIQKPGLAQQATATKYQHVAISTKGRTIHDAAENALRAANHLRAIWNLVATFRTWNMFYDPSVRLAVIHLGPVHTLHVPSTCAPQKQFWYEPDYTGDQKIFAPPSDWQKIEGDRRSIMKKLQELKYADDILDILGRYLAALDSPNLSTALLHMWGILEKITCTVGASYDETIRRASRLFNRPEIVRDQLEAVRTRRNQFVHAAGASDDASLIARVVKSFVDPHLIQLVFNDFGVDSLEEYAECLSLPRDSSDLKKRTERLQKQMVWIEKWAAFGENK
jgi:hypothetical protein